MHPLGLLLSITFFTILAIHMLTETIKSLRTDAAGCATAETWRIQQHLLEYGATDRVKGAWPGRANPLISRIHRATATLEARVT
jgi:hypothetical protein